MGTIHKTKQLLVRLKGMEVEKLLAQQNRMQAELAKSMGVSTQYIWFLLRGQRQPSARMRKRIMAEFKGRAWDELFEFVR